MTVISPGPLSTVQDLGRPGFGYLGVGRSGAADRRSLRLANHIVGNDKSAAAIEMTLGRLRARFERDAVLALSGAPCEFRIDGAPGRMNTATKLLAGQELRVGAPSTGLRTYLAVQGGIDVPPVLGSRATDTLAHLGPQKLSAGMVLPLGLATGPTSEVDPPADLEAEPVLTVIAGPRDDWFTPGALLTLCAATWSVTVDADRIGVRLAGPVLSRSRTAELPSEPMVTGAVQVPPSGQPIIFLADHPVTGGYPVVAVITGADTDLAGQLRPGQHLRFRLSPGDSGDALDLRGP